MDEDRGQPERLTDEELTRCRRTRYGALPARIAESELVETRDPEPARPEPPDPPVRREWG